MTRNEEIQKLIDEETGIDNFGGLDYQVGVMDGVRLADKTMIEKACKWLDANFPEIKNSGSWYKESFIEQFKKAMKE